MREKAFLPEKKEWFLIHIFLLQRQSKGYKIKDNVVDGTFAPFILAPRNLHALDPSTTR